MKSEIYEIHCNIKCRATLMKVVKIAGNSTLKLFNYVSLIVYVVCPRERVAVEDNLRESSLLPPGGSWRWNSGSQAWQ